MRRLLKELDLGSWDNWLPLAVIAAFGCLGVLIAFRVVSFPGLSGGVDRLRVIYDAVGIRTGAGVFATVVSLSLVAIQFASQQYSHRIMTFYMRSLMLWSMIVVYLGLIIASILLEAHRTESQDPRLAAIIVVGAIMAIVLLVPHFVVTAAFLRPEFVIGKLLRRLDTEYLLIVQRSLQEGSSRLDSRMDRLLPVVEIVERAVDRGDVTTTRGAMERLNETYMAKAEKLNSLPVEQFFLGYLLRIGRKAVSVSNEEASVHAVRLIGGVGAWGPAGAIAVDDIRDLGFVALKKDLEPVLHQMLDSLRLIYESTELAEARSEVLEASGQLLMDLASGKKRRPLRHLAENLFEMARDSLSRHDVESVGRFVELLESLGHEAGVYNLADVVLQVVRHLQGLGTEAAQEEPEVAQRIVQVLLSVEKAVGTKEREVLAATESAKGDIERLLVRPAAQAAPAASVADLEAEAPARRPGPQVEAVVDFSELRSEPKK